MSTFDRVTATIADLDHPLYEDEHRRDVWNEAAAIAYQAMTWGLVIAVVVLAWFGGPSSTLPILLVAAVLVVPSMVAAIHAQRRGVDAWSIPGTGPRRIALLVVLAVVGTAGMVVNSLDRVPDVATGAGLATGALVGGLVGAGAMLAVMGVVTRRAKRHAPVGED